MCACAVVWPLAALLFNLLCNGVHAAKWFLQKFALLMKQINFVLKEIKDWYVDMFLLYRKATSKCYLSSRELSSDLVEIHGKAHSTFSERFGNKGQIEYVLPLIPLILVLEELFHA